MVPVVQSIYEELIGAAFGEISQTELDRVAGSLRQVHDNLIALAERYQSAD